MKNYSESRLFNNIKVLKILLNFLKVIKMRYFKRKVDTVAAKAQTNNEWRLIELKKKKHREKK